MARGGHRWSYRRRGVARLLCKPSARPSTSPCHLRTGPTSATRTAHWFSTYRSETSLRLSLSHARKSQTNLHAMHMPHATSTCTCTRMPSRSSERDPMRALVSTSFSRHSLSRHSRPQFRLLRTTGESFSYVSGRSQSDHGGMPWFGVGRQISGFEADKKRVGVSYRPSLLGVRAAKASSSHASSHASSRGGSPRAGGASPRVERALSFGTEQSRRGSRQSPRPAPSKRVSL